MQMTDVLRPGIILSELLFPYLDRTGVVADTVERIADEGFFRRAEIAVVSDAAERKRIAEAVGASDLHILQWMTLTMMQEGLNPSVLDEAQRTRCVRRIIELTDYAAECGADMIALYSGPDPGPDLRGEATRRLGDSLAEICRAAAGVGLLKVLIEPLDREAHKKALIGPTSEAVSLLRDFRSDGAELALNWDSSHTALNGEDLLDSLALAADYLDQIHLANAILDPCDPDFGDFHMAIGKPGFLDAARIAAIFRKALEIGFLGLRRPCVAVEVRTPDGGDPWRVERQCRDVLAEAWRLLEQMEATP